MDGLPSGQLSFMLKAGSDILPTSMNLQRYKIQSSPTASSAKDLRP